MWSLKINRQAGVYRREWASCGLKCPAQTVPRQEGGLSLLVKDLMTLKSEDTVFHAARVMREKKIGCLPVVHADGSMAGILTETDLLQLLVKPLDRERSVTCAVT